MIQAVKVRALESALAEENAEVLQGLIDELEQDREANEQTVLRLAESRNERVRSVAQEILSRWGYEVRKEDYKIPVVEFLYEWTELEDLCWLLCKSKDPSFKIRHGRALLDQLGESVEIYLMGADATPEAQWQALRRVLAQDEEFDGNRDDYYDADNSYLNRVLETRKGIPLSLTLLYLFVGRRAGIEVRGLNAPGHFLACVDSLVFDPFHGGRSLSCCELAERLGVSQVKKCHLQHLEASPMCTAKRMLMNLLNSYVLRRDFARQQVIGSYLNLLEEKCA